MLPILTSGEGLFDVFGGEASQSGEAEGAQPGGFLELLSAISSLSTEAQAGLETEGESGEDSTGLEVAQLLARPELPATPTETTLGLAAEGGGRLGGPLNSLLPSSEGLLPHESGLPTLTSSLKDFEGQRGGLAELNPAATPGAELHEAGQALRAFPPPSGDQSQPTTGPGLPSGEATSLAGVSAEAGDLQPDPADPALAAQAKAQSSEAAEGAEEAEAELEADDSLLLEGEVFDEGESSGPSITGEAGLHRDRGASSDRNRDFAQHRGGALGTDLVEGAPPLEVGEGSDLSGLDLDLVDATAPLDGSEAVTTVDGSDLIGQIEISITPDQEEARIQLHPEELGRVDVHVRRRNGRMVATLTVERIETMAEIEAHLPELHEALAERGLEIDEIDLRADPAPFDAEHDSSQRGSRQAPSDWEGPWEGRRDASPSEPSQPRPRPRLLSAVRSGPNPARVPGAALDTLA